MSNKCIKLVNFISRYLESADITDSDDLLDVSVSNAVEEEIDTIEKVVDHRIGKKGGKTFARTCTN